MPGPGTRTARVWRSPNAVTQETGHRAARRDVVNVRRRNGNPNTANTSISIGRQRTTPAAEHGETSAGSEPARSATGTQKWGDAVSPPQPMRAAMSSREDGHSPPGWWTASFACWPGARPIRRSRTRQSIQESRRKLWTEFSDRAALWAAGRAVTPACSTVPPLAITFRKPARTWRRSLPRDGVRRDAAEVVIRYIDGARAATSAPWLQSRASRSARSTKPRRSTGLLREQTPEPGPLAGRAGAALALGMREDVPVLTADRSLAELDLGVSVLLNR